MAIGTSGYIESVHTRVAPIKPSEKMHTLNMLGTFLQAAQLGVQVYDKFQSNKLGKLHTQYERDVALIENSGVSTQEIERSIKELNKSYTSPEFVEKFGDLYGTYGSHMDKVATVASVKASKERNDQFNSSAMRGLATYSVNGGASDVPEQVIASMSGDRKLLAQQYTNEVVNQLAVNIKRQSSIESPEAFIAEVNKAELVMEKLRQNPRFLGDTSEQGSKNARYQENIFAQAVDQNKKQLVNQIRERVVASISPTSLEQMPKTIQQIDNDFNMLEKLGDTPWVQRTKDDLNKKLEQYAVSVRLEQLGGLDPTVPLFPEARNIIRDNAEFKKVRDSRILEGASVAIGNRDFATLNQIVEANPNSLTDTRNVMSNLVSSAQALEELAPHFEAYATLGYNNASKIYSAESLDILVTAPIIAQSTGEDLVDIKKQIMQNRRENIPLSTVEKAQFDLKKQNLTKLIIQKR
jgi:hypothetical protein